MWVRWFQFESGGGCAGMWGGEGGGGEVGIRIAVGSGSGKDGCGFIVVVFFVGGGLLGEEVRLVDIIYAVESAIGSTF